MSSRIPRRIRICTYCPGEADSRDHAPPKCLLGPGVEGYKVPACTPCNNRYSLDDEYVKTILAVEAKAQVHPTAQALKDSVFRALGKPEKSRFAKAVFGDARLEDAYSPAGLYLGKVGTYPVNLDRLYRFVERCVRGLHVRETGSTLHAAGVHVFGPDDLEAQSIEWLRATQNAVTGLLQRPTVSFGDGVFEYRFLPTERPLASLWFVTLLRSKWYLAVTLPAEEPGSSSEREGAR